ncbi:helix-turn-helix transcriptional regulator [Streptomyces montanus]|uniref:Helix-turn-helix transcriptional regulator n=1 Tax=Streptomyces montanus TaxID=2580423 RepID=A0A5R9FVY1_9ACTN|nr:helix-turn-helix transcriptional regulator [Streptomyces montanus]TLS46090.1 helix-turn-helix transcriptional regulator [Streptomyces montanus]
MIRLPGTNIVITPLTPMETQVLEQMSLGCDPDAGAAALSMKRTTFNRHSTQIGLKLQVKGAAVKVHMGYVAGQLTPPDPAVAPEEFDDAEQRLWRALALHDASAEIARAAGVNQFDLSDAVERLLEKAGAQSEAHLIRLGHAFGLLTTALIPQPSAPDS